MKRVVFTFVADINSGLLSHNKYDYSFQDPIGNFDTIFNSGQSDFCNAFRIAYTDGSIRKVLC